VKIGDLSPNTVVEVFPQGSSRGDGSFIAKITKILHGGYGQLGNEVVLAQIVEDHPASSARTIRLGGGTAARPKG